MADDNSLKLFGFEISRARNEKKKEQQLPSIVPPLDDDGAGYVTAAGSHYGSYVDLTGEQAKDDKKPLPFLSANDTAMKQLFMNKFFEAQRSVTWPYCECDFFDLIL